MTQIWKDTPFGISVEEQPIEITVDGETVYKGTLSSFPDSTGVKTQLNRLCESFLSLSFPETTGVTPNPEACRTFIIKDGNGTILRTEQFIYDWSYGAFKPVLSDPVNGHLDNRMRAMYTMYRSNSGTVHANLEII